MVEKYPQISIRWRETFSFSISALFFSQIFQEDNQVVFCLVGKRLIFSQSVLVEPVEGCVFISLHQFCLAIGIRAETNTLSTRLPGSSKYPNYPIAGIRIR